MEPREKKLDCIYRKDGPEETNDENNLDALLDLLPEFRVYRDEGCRFSGSCLNCTLPVCVHDVPDGTRKLNRLLRYREIVRRRGAGGSRMSVARLAAHFRVSQSTVKRAIKAGKSDASGFAGADL